MIGLPRAGAILSAWCIALAAGTPTPSPGQPATLPSAAEGWTRMDSVGVYAGKDLFLLIDGGADLFFEYGFVTALTTEYSRGPDHDATVELYEMENPEAAYGLFTSFTAGTGTAVRIGQEAVLGEGYCIFWKGPYVMMLTATSVDSILAPMILQLAEGLEAGLHQTGELPDLCRLLREAGIEPRNMVFVRGKLALGNQFPQAWTNSLRPADGVVGDADSCRYMILEYPDAGDAGAALHTATAEWENAPVPASPDPSGTWRIAQAEGSVTILERQERYVLAVSGRTEKSEALAARLRRILGNE